MKVPKSRQKRDTRKARKNNFFQPIIVELVTILQHMGLGVKISSEACGIEISGNDKWKTLIQNASR